MRSLYIGLVCALIVAFSVPAFSSPMTYLDQSSWLNATDPNPLNTNLAPYIGINYTDSTGLAIPGGPEFVGVYSGLPPFNSGYFLNVASAAPGPYVTWDAMNTFITTSFLQVIFPTPVTSVGFKVYGNGNTYSVKVNNGTTYTTSSVPVGSWTSTFFGITSPDDPIWHLDIALASANQNTPFLNNLQYGSALTAPPPVDAPQDTPEICTSVMIASALIFFARWRRRRMTTAVA